MSTSLPEPVLLPWDRFANWAHCLCVVTFDLELGQSLELVYPKHVTLHDNEKLNVCYLAFPDSYSGRMGDTQYHFRIRRYALPYRLPAATEEYNRRCPSHMQVHEAYMYGFVYFRQARDKAIRRGYFQKSVVLLSPYPFFRLFSELLALVAPEYFAHGPPGLEAACHDLDQWPAPVCGQPLLLPLVGQVLQVGLPVRADQQRTGAGAGVGPGETPPAGEADAALPPDVEDKAGEEEVKEVALSPTAVTRTLHSVHELDLSTALGRLLPHAQLLWELVLLSEPIVVLAPSPPLAALVVQALVGCIAPLRFATDFRPYFTIHDTEFREFTTRTQRAPPVILGVTNPFFAKALAHWPHVVRLADDGPASRGREPGAGPLRVLDAPTGVYTRYKPFLARDRASLRRLTRGGASGRPCEAQGALLRRFFLELTQSFVIPLERHLAGLMPLQRTVSAWRAVPALRRFRADDFLASVAKSGPRLTCGVKGDWAGLYRRFFRSPNFAAWFAQRQAEVGARLVGLRADLLARQDLSAWARDRSEVEVVDMVLHLRELARAAAAKHLLACVAPDEAAERARALRRQIDVLTDGLSEDLRGILQG